MLLILLNLSINVRSKPNCVNEENSLAGVLEDITIREESKLYCEMKDLCAN